MFIEYHSEVLLDMIRCYFFIPILENSSKIGKILFYLKSSFVANICISIIILLHSKSKQETCVAF